VTKIHTREALAALTRLPLTSDSALQNKGAKPCTRMKREMLRLISELVAGRSRSISAIEAVHYEASLYCATTKNGTALTILDVGT